jgi:hypothetical protein
MTPTCATCIHLMSVYQTADGVRRCRVYDGLPVSPALEADCKQYIREPGSDDQVPPWYSGAWVLECEASN